MRNWTIDNNKLNISCDTTDSRLEVEYFPDTDNFCIAHIHYEGKYGQDIIRRESYLSRRSLQVFIEFFKENSKGSGFWKEQNINNEVPPLQEMQIE